MAGPETEKPRRPNRVVSALGTTRSPRLAEQRFRRPALEETATETERIEFTPHVNHITTAAVQSTYALRTLRAHGLNGPDLWGVTRTALLRQN